MKLILLPALVFVLFAFTVVSSQHPTRHSASADLLPNSMALDADAGTTAVEETRTVSGTASFRVGINVTSVGSVPYRLYLWEFEFPTSGLAYDGNVVENTSATGLPVCSGPQVTQATIPSHTRVGTNAGCGRVPATGTLYVGQTTSFDMHCVRDGTFDIWLDGPVIDPAFYTSLFDVSFNEIPTRLEGVRVTCTGTGD